MAIAWSTSKQALGDALRYALAPGRLSMHGGAPDIFFDMVFFLFGAQRADCQDSGIRLLFAAVAEYAYSEHFGDGSGHRPWKDA